MSPSIRYCLNIARLNHPNIARSQFEYDTVYWDTKILPFYLTKWSLPGRTRLLSKTRLEPLHSVLSEYDPGRIIQILPGHNPSMTRSIRIKLFCLFFDKMEPPRQDQATHQDKDRVSPFGIIRIWPWSNLANMARSNHPNIARSQSEYDTAYIRMMYRPNSARSYNP